MEGMCRLGVERVSESVNGGNSPPMIPHKYGMITTCINLYQSNIWHDVHPHSIVIGTFNGRDTVMYITILYWKFSCLITHAPTPDLIDSSYNLHMPVNDATRSAVLISSMEPGGRVRILYDNHAQIVRILIRFQHPVFALPQLEDMISSPVDAVTVQLRFTYYSALCRLESNDIFNFCQP